MDLIVLKEWAAAGAPVIYLAGILALWRQNTQLQNKYEALLRECLTTLIVVGRELSELEAKH